MSDREDRTVEYRGSGFYVSVVVIVILGVILLVFALQNTADVTVKLFAIEVDLPLFGVAIGAGLVTLIIDQLVGLAWRHQRRRRLQDRRELTRLRAGTVSVDDEPESVNANADTNAEAPSPPNHDRS